MREGKKGTESAAAEKKSGVTNGSGHGNGIAEQKEGAFDAEHAAMLKGGGGIGKF